MDHPPPRARYSHQGHPCPLCGASQKWRARSEARPIGRDASEKPGKVGQWQSPKPVVMVPHLHCCRHVAFVFVLPIVLASSLPLARVLVCFTCFVRLIVTGGWLQKIVRCYHVYLFRVLFFAHLQIDLKSGVPFLGYA